MIYKPLEVRKLLIQTIFSFTVFWFVCSIKVTHLFLFVSFAQLLFVMLLRCFITLCLVVASRHLRSCETGMSDKEGQKQHSHLRLGAPCHWILYPAFLDIPSFMPFLLVQTGFDCNCYFHKNKQYAFLANRQIRDAQNTEYCLPCTLWHVDHPNMPACSRQHARCVVVGGSGMLYEHFFSLVTTDI